MISESRETKQICTTQSLANCFPGYPWGLNPRVEKDGFVKCPRIWMCFLVNTLGTNSLCHCLVSSWTQWDLGYPQGLESGIGDRTEDEVGFLTSVHSIVRVVISWRKERKVWWDSLMAACWWQRVYIYSLYLVQQWPFISFMKIYFSRISQKHFLPRKLSLVLWINVMLSCHICFLFYLILPV